MNGFIKRTTLLAWRGTAMTAVAFVVAAGAGCVQYRDLVDPCYPERYEFAARKEVHEGFVPQVQNGHILDQTIWNWMFYPGKEQLHPSGMEHLTYLIRRRPAPDAVIYLASSQDIAYDPAAPEKFVAARNDLNQRRKVAIEKYVAAQAADRGLKFEVMIHDPAEPALPGEALRGAAVRWYGAFQGSAGAAGPPTTTSTAGGLGLSGNITGAGTGGLR